MRILMVCARYLPFMGGIETHVREVSVRLASRGHDVTILTTDPTGALAKSERQGRLDILRVKAWPKERDYYFAPGIVSHIEAGTWDVIHIQGYHTLVPPLAILAAMRKGIPFVVTFHSGGHSSALRTAMRSTQQRLLAPLFRHAAQLIGVSEFEADHFSRAMKIPRENFVVVPNGAQLTDAAPQVRHAPSDPLIISIGRLERYKGHHRAIEAFPQVLKQLPEARLRVLGEGPYKQSLVELTHKLGLQDRVEIGGIPIHQRAEMTSLLSQAALVLLLSDYEAHPVAVMEAVSLGRQVLVTDCTGLHEIAAKGHAKAIPLAATAEETANAIVKEIQSPRVMRDLKLPNWDDCAEALLRVYEKVALKACGTEPARDTPPVMTAPPIARTGSG